MEQNKDQIGAAVRGEAVAESALRFRKKPVEISAIQWTGANLHQVTTFMEVVPPDVRGMYAGERWEDYAEHVRDNGLSIPTLEGPMHASVNDWIICGVKGEHYACKPNVFEMTYESARAADALSEPIELTDEQIEKIRAKVLLHDIDHNGKRSPDYEQKFARAIEAAVKSRAADALDSQPTDSVYLRKSYGFWVVCDYKDVGATKFIASSQPTDGGVRNG